MIDLETIADGPLWSSVKAKQPRRKLMDLMPAILAHEAGHIDGFVYRVTELTELDLSQR